MQKHIVIEFLPRFADAGAETIVRDYCLFGKNNEKVSIIPLVIWGNSGSANEKIIKENGIPIISIYKRMNLLTRAFNKFCGNLYIPYRICKIIKKTNANSIHFHLALLSYAEKIAEKSTINMFYTCHNLPSYYFPNNECIEYKAAYSLVQIKRLRLIALHYDMKKELDEMFSTDNTVVIRNGIDLKKYSEIKISKEQKRIEIGIPKNAFVVGHIGRFAEQKNHSLLVDIFCEVKKRNEKAFLLLIGEGELKSIIEEKLRTKGIEDYLILSRRSDVNELLRAMDVFVFPSLFEGLGIVLIEAQAAGIRCVCSDVVPCEAFVTPNIIPLSLSKNVETWADVILDNTSECQYENRLCDYDMNNEMDRLIGLYLNPER